VNNPAAASAVRTKSVVIMGHKQAADMPLPIAAKKTRGKNGLCLVLNQTGTVQKRDQKQ
jgi:hypothetical protein